MKMEFKHWQVDINGYSYFVCEEPNRKRKYLYGTTENELKEKFDRILKDNKTAREYRLAKAEGFTVADAYADYMRNSNLSVAERKRMISNEYLIEEYKDMLLSDITEKELTEWLLGICYLHKHEIVEIIYARMKAFLSYYDKALAIAKPDKLFIKKCNEQTANRLVDVLTNENGQAFREFLFSQDRNATAMYLCTYLDMAENNSLVRLATLKEFTYGDLKHLIALKETNKDTLDRIIYKKTSFSIEIIDLLIKYANYKRYMEDDEFLFSTTEKSNRPLDNTTVIRFLNKYLFEYGLPTNILMRIEFRSTEVAEDLGKEIEQFVNGLEINRADKERLYAYMEQYKNMMLGVGKENPPTKRNRKKK